MRIRLDRVLLPPPIPAGMNPLVLMSLAYHLRTGGEVDPIVVDHQDDGYFRIVDGRHRFVASLIAGCKTVRATVRTDYAHVRVPLRAPRRPDDRPVPGL